MKSCRVCHIEKELFEFNKNSRNRDNLNNMCKECGKELVCYSNYQYEPDKFTIKVEPCKACIEEAESDAYDAHKEEIEDLNAELEVYKSN